MVIYSDKTVTLDKKQGTDLIDLRRPLESNLTSDLGFVAQIAYETMFVWAV